MNVFHCVRLASFRRVRTLSSAAPRPSALFASDNTAGCDPRVLQALSACNAVRCDASYGGDQFSARAKAALRAAVGAESADVHFTFNGTAANVLGLGAVCAHSTDAVVVADTSHIHTAEAGAPEKFLGVKVLCAPADRSGKLSPEAVESVLCGFDDFHANTPRVLSVAQCTEFGTLYTLAELQALAECAHRHRMLLHVDGARLANAAAALACSLRELAAHIDVLSFGGTKNGLLFGEAVILFGDRIERVVGTQHHLARFETLRKQAMQLHSKMRFIACQYEALLSSEVWRENATHANNMARALADAVQSELSKELVVTRPVETNAVFVRFRDDATRRRLARRVSLDCWAPPDDEIRLMTSFATRQTDIDWFSGLVRGVEQ